MNSNNRCYIPKARMSLVVEDKKMRNIRRYWDGQYCLKNQRKLNYEVPDSKNKRLKIIPVIVLALFLGILMYMNLNYFLFILNVI